MSRRLSIRLRQWIGDWANATKLDLVGLAMMPYAAGAAFAAGASAPRVLTASAAGGSLHVATALINNVADRASDALHPRRRDTPIVQGRISPRRAIGVASLAVLLAALLLLLLVPLVPFLVVFLPLMAVQSYGNAFQKRSRRVPPMAMDFLFGLTMGLPLVTFSLVDPPASSAAPLWLAVVLTIDMVALNVAVGNTKDLPWDQAAGDRTTALALGVRGAREGSTDLLPTPVFRAYVTLLLLARTAPLAVALRGAGVELVVRSAMVVASLIATGLWLAGTRARHLPARASPARWFVPIDLATLLLAFLVIEPDGLMASALAIVLVASVLGLATSRVGRERAPKAATG